MQQGTFEFCGREYSYLANSFETGWEVMFFLYGERVAAQCEVGTSVQQVIDWFKRELAEEEFCTSMFTPEQAELEQDLDLVDVDEKFLNSPLSRAQRELEQPAQPFDPATAALQLQAGDILQFEYPTSSCRDFLRSLREFDTDESPYHIPHEWREAQLFKATMTNRGNVVLFTQQRDGTYRTFSPELIRNLAILG